MLLHLQGIKKDFDGLQVLQGIDLKLAAGEVRALIGPNGCGKTTLFNIITGAFAPSAGRVLFRDQDITALRPNQIARLGIARKFQVPGIFPSLSVAENLEAAGLSVAQRSWTEYQPRIDLNQLLDRYGLAAAMTRAAGTLSHGLKQWLEIAMLLRMNAAVLLLDEPTAGMSAVETEQTAQLVADVARRYGVAVLAIEHDMSFVRALACPVLVSLRGRIIFEGSYEAARAQKEVRDAYLGNA